MTRKINASLVKIITLLIITILINYLEYIISPDHWISYSQYTYNIFDNFKIASIPIPMGIFKMILGASMCMSGLSFHVLLRKEESCNKKKGKYYIINIKILLILILYISVLLRISEISLFVVNIIASIFSMTIYMFTRKSIFRIFGKKGYIKIFYYGIVINCIGNLVFLLKNIFGVKYNQKLIGMFSNNDILIKEFKYLIMIFPFMIILLTVIIYRYIQILKSGVKESSSLKEERRYMCEFGMCSVIMSLGVFAAGGMVFFVGLVIPYFCRYLFGNSKKTYLFGTAICGGVFYMIADIISIYTIFEIKIIVPLICMPYIIFMFYKMIFE